MVISAWPRPGPRSAAPDHLWGEISEMDLVKDVRLYLAILGARMADFIRLFV